MNEWIIIAVLGVYGISLWLARRSHDKDMCFVMDNVTKLLTAHTKLAEELKSAKEKVAECEANIESIRDMTADIAKAEAEFQEGIANIRDYDPYTAGRNNY